MYEITLTTLLRRARVAPALLLTLSACTGGAVPAFVPTAVSPAPAPSDPQTQLNEIRAAWGEVSRRLAAARSAGNPLTELEALRAMDREGGTDAVRAAVALEAQRLAAEVGAYAEAHRFADRLEDAAAERPIGPSLEGHAPVPALGFVGRAAEGAQVVMLNEAHHVPQHRAFTLRLLVELRARGFTHFAAETLSEADAALGSRGYPVKATGPYINEPLYGEMVRTALRLGYRVVPYEAPPSAPDRESAQAANLVQRILRADPQARILVHAGYRHINESGLLAGKVPMAAQFRQLTGIDPFTVDQTEMTEHGSPEYEHPLYRRLAPAADTDPVVWQAAGTAWTVEPGLRDVTVVHPPSHYEGGRPTWLRRGGGRRVYPLPASVCGAAARCLVRAYYAGENVGAVPADQVEVVRGRAVPSLILPPGRYSLRVEDAAGAEVSGTEITVGR